MGVCLVNHPVCKYCTSYIYIHLRVIRFRCTSTGTHNIVLYIIKQRFVMFLCPSRPLFQRTQEIVIVCASARVSAVYIRLHPQCTTTTQCRIVVHRPQYCVAPIKYIGCIPYSVYTHIHIYVCASYFLIRFAIFSLGGVQISRAHISKKKNKKNEKT